MANYTISQCLTIAAIPEDKKEWLRKMQASKLPTVNGRTFTAQNQAALVTLVSQEFEKYTAAKAKRDNKNAEREQCFEILRQLLGAKKTHERESYPQLISPSELLPKLQELKTSIEQENKFAKIDKAISASGMTKEQLIEYLTNN